MCITKHKIDIRLELVRNIDINTMSFPGITLSYICFLSITLIIIRATVKSFQHKVFCAPCMFIDLRLFSEEICNDRLICSSDNVLPEPSLSHQKKARKSQIFSGFF